MSSFGTSLGSAAPQAPAAAPAARRASQALFEWVVATYAVLLISGSIVMFMMGATSAKVGELINAQNEAALKLWDSLDYYKFHGAVTAKDASLPPGLFASLVEFSRTNAAIVKTVHRLSLGTVFSPRADLNEIAGRWLKPTDGKPETAGYFNHFGVDPATDAGTVVAEGLYQIELYQALRDYAQDESSFYKDCLSAVSAYLLPVLYALLGAFLWAFRASTRGPPAEPAPEQAGADRSSRFVMAAIAGIAISVLGKLLPSDAVVSPLAVAFVFGYSSEVFTARLDAYIAGLAKPGSKGG